jgi:uncharacterized membrane protein
MGLAIALSTNNPFMALVLVPAGAIGTVVALPFLVLALVIALISVALPFGILTAILGGPFYVFHRLTRRAGDAEDVDQDDDEDAPVRLGPEGILRRRYVAGELTYTQFRDGMLDTLKRRFAVGDLNVTQYERELQLLIEPARVLDTRNDPAVAGTLVRPGPAR